MTDHFLDPSLLSQVVDETAGEWRRDLAWGVRCRCGHGHESHNPELKTSSPCSVGGCGCRFMRPEFVVWRETRWVLGRIGCACGAPVPFDGGAEGVCECCSTCTPEESA